MTTRSLKRKKITLATIFSPAITDTGRSTSPTGAVFIWQYHKIFVIFAPSLGSLVVQICEKRNPSGVIRNKDGKSLSYRSQDAREASRCAHSLLTLFTGNLPRATVQDEVLGWTILQLFLMSKQLQKIMHMATEEKPNPSQRAFSRVSNDSSFFQDLVMPFKKQKLAAAWQCWGREEMLNCFSRNNILLMVKRHPTHHILLGCVFVALQDTDSVFVAHVLYLCHRVVSKLLQGRNRSLLFLQYFVIFVFLVYGKYNFWSVVSPWRKSIPSL